MQDDQQRPTPLDYEPPQPSTGQGSSMVLSALAGVMFSMGIVFASTIAGFAILENSRKQEFSPLALGAMVLAMAVLAVTFVFACRTNRGLFIGMMIGTGLALLCVGACAGLL